MRVVGPSFDLVSSWADRGIPLKIAFNGIDRSFERYHRKGPRRRPLKIDFCDADVLDAFDEWRRAIGLAATADIGDDEATERGSRTSLPAHLERVVMRLTQARAGGAIDESFDQLIDAVARELDAARLAAKGLRGAARQALLDRLSDLDTQLLQHARTAIDDVMRASLTADAGAEIAGFQDRMTPDAFARVRDAASDRLLRERLGLPVVAFR